MELVKVDVVLGVVGELAQLLHPRVDEVFHGAILDFRLHVEQRVHGVQVITQLGDLGANTGEQLVLLAQKLLNIAHNGLRRTPPFSAALVLTSHNRWMHNRRGRVVVRRQGASTSRGKTSTKFE